MMNRISIAQGLRYTSLVSISLISVAVFAFALVSGSEKFGGGLSGIIKNAPNALPWLGLIALSIVAWRNPAIGGILTIIFGLVATYFYNFSGSNFFMSTFIMTCSIVLLGILLLLSSIIKIKTL